MANKKRGSLGKKAARLRAAAGASATISEKPLAHGRGGQPESRKWGVDSTFAEPSVPGKLTSYPHSCGTY
jgi:hypothetical protein